MLLAISVAESPMGSPGWQNQVAGKLGHDWTYENQAFVEAHFLKAWEWSRAAEKVAGECAERAALNGDELTAAVALAVARRHNGVWRAAKKMHKIGPTGATIRSAVAVRADAGDVSCPSWIARETPIERKRSLR